MYRSALLSSPREINMFILESKLARSALHLATSVAKKIAREYLTGYARRTTEQAIANFAMAHPDNKSMLERAKIAK